MLLTITTTHHPATDLGYLLHKHPARAQMFEFGFGQSHVFYPRATEEACTAALLLDVDPVRLVRGSGRGDDGFLDQYVNDRPYVVSSFMSVALSRVYGTALSGRCEARPELVDQPLPLEVQLPVIVCRGGESVPRALFEPLGYEVEARRLPLGVVGIGARAAGVWPDATGDESRVGALPEWGEGRHFALTLRGTVRLQYLLRHLTVLIPVLDDDKHYWVGTDEVDKLLRRGEGWLAAHPRRELIAERYLSHKHRLTRDALARLTEADADPDPDADAASHDEEEQAVERPLSLGRQRIEAVVAALKEAGARRVLDLGCGEGRLVQELLTHREFVQITAMDVAYGAVEKARSRLRWETMPEARRRRLSLFQGSLTYRDNRLAGHDAAVVMEVIEHLDPDRLDAFARALFGAARPRTVLVTTPNAEFNVTWESLPAGRFRHHDHRFEWTRQQFHSWAGAVAAAHGYTVSFTPIGPNDEVHGAPTQMAVFREGNAAGSPTE